MEEKYQVPRIRKLLQDEEVQMRIQENIRRGQADVKVTIGRASELFQLKASKLRELDDLLFPGRVRSKDAGTVQRQYSLTELNKLAIISDLLNNEKVSLSEIPSDIDEIWAEVAPARQRMNGAKSTGEPDSGTDAYLTIDQRVEKANEEAFWRYFTAQALKLSLNLICEDIPDVVAGIILPLNRKTNASLTLNSEHIDQLGECLIGWRDQHGSFVTFYTHTPSFDFHTDFRIRGLQAWEETEPQDKTFVVLERKAVQLRLSLSVVETIRRLIAPIYEDAPMKKSFFEKGMKDAVYPAIPPVGTTIPDTMLTSFTDMAVRLGGKTTSGENRWKFCAILMPNNPLLSLQQRSLVVQAQSHQSPHDIGKTSVFPDTPFLSLSLRAFQGIRVLYRSHISENDETIAYRDEEGPIQSAIAIPIAKKDGLPVAVLYLVSDEQAAFDIEYQRVLRLIGLMIGELLEASRVLSQNEERVSDAVEHPQEVNKTLGSFLSENDFVKDMEAILRDINENGSASMEGITSCISIDVDDLSRYTSTYGDQILVNLSKALGNRIEGQIGLLFDKQKGCKLYHIFADRFYLLINDVTLEKARESAVKLRQELSGNYPVSIFPTHPQTSLAQPRSRVDLEGITVRLGVTNYKHEKLYDLLNRYPSDTRIADVLTGSVLYFLDEGLNTAKKGGKGRIVSYYPPDENFEHSRYTFWEPSKSGSE